MEIDWISSKSEQRPKSRDSLVIIAKWYDGWNYYEGYYNEISNCIVIMDYDNNSESLFFNGADFDCWVEINSPNIKMFD